jgi:hypothetical protein
MDIVHNFAVVSAFFAATSSVGLAQTPVKLDDALTARFKNFTTGTCKMPQWYKVTKGNFFKSAEKMPNGPKDRQAIPYVPSQFVNPWPVGTVIAREFNGVTAASITEKIYTAEEIKDLNNVNLSDAWTVLQGSSAVPDISLVSSIESLSYYSHSCSYLVNLGVKMQGEYTLPFFSVQAGAEAAFNTTSAGSMVMIGGTFPSRLFTLFNDSDRSNQLFAAATVWDWYTRKMPAQLPLYYVQSVKGFADAVHSSLTTQINGRMNANAGLNFVFGSADGNTNGSVNVQENVYSQAYHFILLPLKETDFVFLPTLAGLQATFNSNRLVRPPGAMDRREFDSNDQFEISEQSKGLPATMCQNREWTFVPKSSNPPVTTEAVKASRGGDSSKPSCLFTFRATLLNPASVSTPFVTVEGTIQTTDVKSGYTMTLPVSLDIYLRAKTSARDINVAALGLPDAWPRPDSRAHNLKYSISVPFEDNGGIIDWTRSFSASDKPVLKCQPDDALKDLAISWVSDATNPVVKVNRDAKSVELQLGVTWYNAIVALDLDSRDVAGAPSCTLSFELKAPRIQFPGTPLPFEINSKNFGLGIFYLPRRFTKPQIRVLLPSGSSGQADQAMPAVLPDAVVGAPYSTASSSIKLVVAGGVSSYTWAWQGSSRPAGLANTIETTDGSGDIAIISGTPLEAGSYSLGVMVTDHAGQTALQKLSLQVRPALAIKTTKDDLTPAKPGTTYTATLAATGGVEPLHWKIPSPSVPQMAISDNGTLTFYAPQNGPVNFTVEVSDSGKPVHTLQVKLSVEVSP